MSSSRPRGVVAAGDVQTAEAGARALRAGGNAVDAAVSAAFAAFVCELPLCSPMGGGVLVAQVGGARPLAMDLFARAPGLGGGRPPELDFVDVEVDFGATTQVFHVGRGSAAVPLALPGLIDVHGRFGRLPLAEVLAPAIELGRDGYVLGAGVAYVFRLLTPIVELSPGSRALFADDEGAIAQAGARLFNRELASSLEAIARRPGVVGELMALLVEEMGPARGGLIGEADLKAAAPTEHAPLEVPSGAWTLSTMPGPSTGGVLIALGLALLRGVGQTEFLSAEHLLAIARAQELVLEQRTEDFDRACRDPDRVAALLAPERVSELRGRLAAGGVGFVEHPLGSTTHISALDGDGGAIALTLTNGEGSGYVLPGTGMVVNNLLGEEDIHPHGFHRDAAGDALTTMMAPTLLARGGDRVALGSGGSNRLRNAILQVVLHLIEHGVEPAAAVMAPRLHLEKRRGAPPRLAFERPGLPLPARAALSAAYPDGVVEFAERSMFFGGTHLALCDHGCFAGAGDPRRGGASVVVG